MDEAEILKYIRMADEDLRRILAGEEPPPAAVWAAAVRTFMRDYHLKDGPDALQQFVRLRKAQGDLLGLDDNEREVFMEGFLDERV
jgi:hypothetical protein